MERKYDYFVIQSSRKKVNLILNHIKPNFTGQHYILTESCYGISVFQSVTGNNLGNQLWKSHFRC